MGHTSSGIANPAHTCRGDVGDREVLWGEQSWDEMMSPTIRGARSIEWKLPSRRGECKPMRRNALAVRGTAGIEKCAPANDT